MSENDTDNDTVELDSNELEESSATEELLHASSCVKDQERTRLQEEIEAFLARGGMIRQIPANVRADPPKKPESNYGGQPI